MLNMLSSIQFFGFTFCFCQFTLLVHCKIEPFVHGGDFARIENYPHSAHLSISCKSASRISNWYCGSSVVNQLFILTAAHCVDGCDTKSYIFASIGKENKHDGLKCSVMKVSKHREYIPDETMADIAVGKLKHPLTFGKYMKRVALMKKPPYNEQASVAGWGMINEDNKIGTVWLQHIKQNVMKRSECEGYLGRLPAGALCAGQISSNKYVAVGDSGSALVVRDFIQIGLVSFKMPQISRSLVVFTDVGYYYDWIIDTIWKLQCTYKQ